LSYVNHHELRQHYKCVLALASVINYHRKHDATIWSITY